MHTEFERKGVKSSKWHYYISSRELTAGELLRYARLEWTVETMHWLLDVHFSEDQCRIENKNIQQNLNMARKLAIKLMKRQEEKRASKRAISKIMFDCLSIFVVLLKIDFGGKFIRIFPSEFGGKDKTEKQKKSGNMGFK